MSALRLRLSNETTWAHEFDADDGADLQRGVREAWDAFIAAGWPGTSVSILGSAWERVRAAHPTLRHRIYLAAVDAWLDERLAREGDQASWKAQANLWRFHAGYITGESASLLALHVQGVATGEWLAPRPGVRLILARRVEEARAAEVLALCARMVEHEKNICALAGHVGEEVRRALFPGPRLVPR